MGIAHFINRVRADRQTKAWRLYQLGWTQQEIADRLNSKRETIRDDLGENSQMGKICDSLGEHWNEESVAEWANRLGSKRETITDKIKHFAENSKFAKSGNSLNMALR